MPASGFLNSAPATPTVTIASPEVEFGLSSVYLTSADFSATTLTLSNAGSLGFSLSGEHFVFTDSAFAGLTMLKTSDNFNLGGLTSSLVGNTLTIDYAGRGGGAIVDLYSAVFTFSGFSGGGGSGGGGSGVPLPAGAWAGLIGLAACGLVAARGRKSILA